MRSYQSVQFCQDLGLDHIEFTVHDILGIDHGEQDLNCITAGLVVARHAEGEYLASESGETGLVLHDQRGPSGPVNTLTPPYLGPSWITSFSSIGQPTAFQSLTSRATASSRRSPAMTHPALRF